MERNYNHFLLKYYNAHPSVKTGPVYPVLGLCPGKITHHFKSDQLKEQSVLSNKMSLLANLRSEQLIANDTLQSINSNEVIDFNEIGSEYDDKMHGTFEIQIFNVKLSEKCIQQLAKSYGEYCTIFFKWKFHKFEKTTTPFEIIGESQGVLNNFIVKYNIVLNVSFYKFLVNRQLSVELHASNRYKEDVIGVGLVSFDHSLENVGKLMICSFTIDDRRNQFTFAQVKIGSKLECNLEILQALKLKFKETTYIDKAEQETLDFFKVKPTLHEDDIIAFHDTLNTVLTRSNCLKISRSEVSNELKERVEWLHQECNWKRTLQEHAILKGEDPFAIKDHQWRTEDTEHIKLRSFPSIKGYRSSDLFITVKSVKFHTNSYIMKDDNIKKIYIEYEFLNYKGQEFETPVSIKKDEKIYFNFRKRFPLDINYNSCDCKLLAEYIKTQECIEFSVVGEPQYRPQTPTLSCTKLAYCRILLLDLVESIEDEVAWKCDIINNNNNTDIVGVLNVKFQGLLSMRRTALQMLAPPEYDLIE